MGKRRKASWPCLLAYLLRSAGSLGAMMETGRAACGSVRGSEQADRCAGTPGWLAAELFWCMASSLMCSRESRELVSCEQETTWPGLRLGLVSSWSVQVGAGSR